VNTLERTRDGVALTVNADEIKRLRAENAALRDELQLAVDNCCNAFFWDGHGERVRTNYGIEFDVAPAPTGYKPGGSREAQRERETA